MDVDRTAPAVGSSELEIAAPPEITWEVLTDIAAWPNWNPEVKSASLEGARCRNALSREVRACDDHLDARDVDSRTHSTSAFST